MTSDDQEAANDGEKSQPIADSWNRLRFIMNPETYVDEDRTVNDLLWQLFLEQRATRYWLRTLCVLLVIIVVLWVTAT